jgi:hypothetical protein
MSLYTCNLDLDEFTLNPVIILPASTWTLSNRLALFWVQLDRNVLINIYLSFIRPILEYGNVIWDNCTQNEANLLESVQVGAGRIWQCMIFSFLSPIWKYLGEAFVPEFSLVLNILREGLDFVEAGRPFQRFTIQTILYGSETSDYNQNVKLFRAVHSFIKRSKRFDNNIVI